MMSAAEPQAPLPTPEQGRRQQAEALFHLRSLQTEGVLGALSPEETIRTVHELQVHQIELEMQNEELRQKQVELDLALQMYFDLYELAPVGYCSLSEHGLILRANLTAARLLGAVRGSMLKQRFSSFIHPMDQDIFYRHRLDLVNTGEPQAFDLRLLKRDKTTFWAHLEASLAQNPGDDSTCRLVLSDISERKETEAQQRRMEALLQQSQKMESLGVLAGGVAHDMNNVLAAILGLASTNLEKVPPESPAHQGFATIIRAAERGGQTVKGLLSFARQTPTEERHLDMNNLIQEGARLLEHTTLAKIDLVLDLAVDLRPILGDASALAHALMNLCVNAVDAMPPNGTLTLRTRNVDSAWIEVVVEDTGAGMSKQVLEKAMDPFFTTKEVGKGTGLGLALVYRTIETHHGQVDIQSAPGKGTRVRLRLPICEPLPQAIAPAAEPKANSGQRSLMVLVVDDDELIRCTMTPLLELLGHRAECVDCGEAALEKLTNGFQPDVVLLDMNMPGLGGAGTLPLLRKLRPTTPVLLATGRLDQFASDQASAFPHVTLLAKPFSMGDLQQQLEQLGPG